MSTGCHGIMLLELGKVIHGNGIFFSGHNVRYDDIRATGESVQ